MPGKDHYLLPGQCAQQREDDVKAAKAGDGTKGEPRCQRMVLAEEKSPEGYGDNGVEKP